MVKKITNRIINRLLKCFGYTLLKRKSVPFDISVIDPEFEEIYAKCKNFTMTSVERAYSLYKSVEYIITKSIDGDFVECGVWKGGSAMLIALTLQHFNIRNRKIYLYDTFTGMTKPTDIDVRISSAKQNALNKWQLVRKNDYVDWAFTPIDEVKINMRSTGYPEDKIFFIKGDVEKTIPNQLHRQIALLRLDTDWYQSTKHELINLFPILVQNGIIILDDYGCWAGSKQAADEYFAKRNIFLSRIDNEGRLGIKTESM